MRQQIRTRQAILDGPRRSRRFHHSFATGAGELGPYMTNHLVAGRYAFQLFRDIFTELAQGSTAIGAALMCGKVRNNLTRQIFREWLAAWTRRSTLLPASR
jgi:hypothetical protein